MVPHLIPSSEFVSITTSYGPVPEPFAPASSDSVQGPGFPPVVALPVVPEPVVPGPVVPGPVVPGPVFAVPVPPVVSPPVPLPDELEAPEADAFMPPKGPPVVLDPPVVCDMPVPLVAPLVETCPPLVGVPPVVVCPPLVGVPPVVVCAEVPFPLVGPPTSDVAVSSPALEPSSEQPKLPTLAKMPTHKVFPSKCAFLIDPIPQR